jgi:hypothetical protein
MSDTRDVGAQKPHVFGKWTLWITWILSAPGIAAGLYILHFHWWVTGKDLSLGTRQGDLAFEGIFGLFFLWGTGLCSTVAATISLAVLWASSGVSRSLKTITSILVCVALCGILLIRLMR